MTAKTNTVIAIVGIGVALTGALTPWPWVLAHHEALRNLGLVAAGAIAVPLAIWRALVAERQAETSRRSLLNERDQKAAEMLGSTLLSVRLGGIYALQTLAAEHPLHYHLGVMRQFCAFVRGPQNPTLTDANSPAGTAPHYDYTPVREDVRAVMDAIAARSEAGFEVEQQEKRFKLDLSGANLREWRFSAANLCGADLCGADLCGADLPGVDLSKADLSKAHLSEAHLSEAHLSEADLFEADLSGANLSRADLCGANLSGANFSGANLSGATFSAGTVIAQEQLDKAVAVPKKSVAPKT